MRPRPLPPPHDPGPVDQDIDYWSLDQADLSRALAVCSREIEQYGVAYAKARHAYEVLAKTEKSVLAEITNQKLVECPDASRREREDMARASERFTTLLRQIADAQHEMLVARARYEAVQAKFEALRSVAATRRTHMQTFRG